MSLVGRSVHSVVAARRAEAEGVDYVVAGQVFASASHAGGQPAEVRLIETISQAVNVPVIAIGGIDARNARDVMRAGAAGVAVISAVLRADDAWAAAAQLWDAIAAGTPA